MVRSVQLAATFREAVLRTVIEGALYDKKMADRKIVTVHDVCFKATGETQVQRKQTHTPHQEWLPVVTAVSVPSWREQPWQGIRRWKDTIASCQEYKLGEVIWING